jgi:hypothetical protein
VADFGGHGKSFGGVLLTWGMVKDPKIGPYIRGSLTLAGVGLRMPASEWLDAVYAVYLNAPHELLEKAHKQMVIGAARLRPDRETWGLLPEHQALGRGLVKGPGGR